MINVKNYEVCKRFVFSESCAAEFVAKWDWINHETLYCLKTVHGHEFVKTTFHEEIRLVIDKT